MESHKRMRIPSGVDRERLVVRDVIPDDVERRGMRLEIHNWTYNISCVLTPAVIETRVNAKLLPRCKTKLGIRGQVPDGEASVILGSRVEAELDRYRYTVGTLYQISSLHFVLGDPRGAHHKNVLHP